MAKEPTPVDRHLGEKLSHARIWRRMSQSDLADTVGLTYQQIQKYESGENRITAAMLHRFSLVLQIQPLWFFEGLGAVAEGEPVPAIDADQRKLLDAFDRIPSDAVRKVLLSFVRNLADGFRSGGPSESAVVIELNRAAAS